MRLTRRGRIVRAILIGAGIALALALALWGAGHIWYTGEGYCIGSMTKCIGL
jgi:hypothetical protein